MGNNTATITIHHPTSLDHGIPYMEDGKIGASTASMLRLEPGAVGWGSVGTMARVTFKKTVQESSWTFQCTKQITSDFEIGREISFTASAKPEATKKLAAQFGISEMEATQSTTMIKNTISNANIYSELYCRHIYISSILKTHVSWTKNDLDLDVSHRRADDNELIIDINFK